ncbi:hypothetical protein PCANC_17296 [Puccinia coronata f. sp. avenae]|uniref:Cation efflux protein transmembrane domain-containing protein n=1 Tax=Puccinia coronata f. sp. avenae TaxID=200324 RepID=A0A2N5UIC5_9BASI|nr:hypothetical protein PCANC_17296 [Puccinia coronata f. sp. avenae]
MRGELVTPTLRAVSGAPRDGLPNASQTKESFSRKLDRPSPPKGFASRRTGLSDRFQLPAGPFQPIATSQASLPDRHLPVKSGPPCSDRYGRVETSLGFANGVFLLLALTFIVLEAVQRLVNPPAMNTIWLLAVSVVGLLVNLVGMFATRPRQHHHGHGHLHDDDHDHVGVIISTLLIERYGWTGFDPIASIFIAILILASGVPLVQDSAKILMLCLDDRQETQVRKALGRLSKIEGLSTCSAPRFWPQNSSTISGSLHLQISPLPSRAESTKTSVSLGIPVMMPNEKEELLSFYGHAELVKKRVKQSLATSIPGLAQLTLQVEGIDGSKNCFCLTGPNS